MEEIREVARFLKARTEDTVEPIRNLILLGDFNIFTAGDATMRALTDGRRLQRPGRREVDPRHQRRPRTRSTTRSRSARPAGTSRRPAAPARSTTTSTSSRTPTSTGPTSTPTSTSAARAGEDSPKPPADAPRPSPVQPLADLPDVRPPAAVGGVPRGLLRRLPARDRLSPQALAREREELRVVLGAEAAAAGVARRDRTVATPAKTSHTTSPGSLEAVMIRSISASGFWLACSDLLATLMRSAPRTAGCCQTFVTPWAWFHFARSGSHCAAVSGVAVEREVRARPSARRAAARTRRSAPSPPAAGSTRGGPG